MWDYGRTIGALAIALAALAAAALLSTAPDAVRWALLICSLGCIGVTLRLRQLDQRSRL